MAAKDERIEQLTSYINLLERLARNGHIDISVLQESLKELHSLMMRQKPELNIFVIEENTERVMKSAGIFMTLFGNVESIKYQNRVRLRNDNIKVTIISLEHYKHLESPELSGSIADYIINNTNMEKAAQFLGVTERK